MGELTGKVALVTGGSRGIGRAIGVALGGLGAKVVVNYTSNEAAATRRRPRSSRRAARR